MKIKINDIWRLTTDPQNFIIEKKSVVKEGKTKGDIKWTAYGFYTKLDQAIVGYCRRCMLDGEETTFDELRAALSALHDEIRSIKDMIGGAK